MPQVLIPSGVSDAQESAEIAFFVVLDIDVGRLEGVHDSGVAPTVRPTLTAVPNAQ